ncbi:ribonuclease J, partial [Candidatus Falkowbacteria bacterium]|nr:ribonuclease J [Candidatus Falkowbacteria bacterium]
MPKRTKFIRSKQSPTRSTSKQTPAKKQSGFTIRKISPIENPKKKITPPLQNKKAQKKKRPAKLRIIPLGGCEEVGRNMTIFEYGNDIVIVDMGLQFPEENMPGIDYIIPNTSYLRGKEQNIRGVIFTHGHMDHIGAAPILLGRIGNPLIIGGKLTIHMIKARQEDYQKGSTKTLKTKIIESTNETLRLGQFTIKFFPVSHSIMDSLGIIIETPVITAIHPGDWKLEHDPIGKPINYKALSKLKKPTVLMLESLGVSYNRPPVSEKEMNKNLETIITNAPGRVVIGTFSSMIERIKVVLEIAERLGKRVAVDGFSMKTSVEIAKKIGYIKFNLKNLIDIRQAGKIPNNKLIIICTGAQGEENAVLARIASGDHRTIKFQKMILLSSPPLLSPATN